MTHTTHETFAWAAGFFDGEGWVGVVPYSVKGRHYKRISAHVAQTNLPILERLQALVRCGRVNGPYEHKNRVAHKEYWTFQTSGLQHTQHLICCMWPWLSPVKRDQARTALVNIAEYYKRVREKPGSKPGQRAADRAATQAKRTL